MSKKVLTGYSGANDAFSMDLTTVDDKVLFANIKMKTNGNIYNTNLSGNLIASKTYVEGQLISQGVATMNNGAQSTSVGSGALVVVGGAGISADVNIGGNLVVNSKAIFNGGIGGSQVTLDNTTDSSSVSTGTLVVAGGVGIAKKTYIGDALNVSGATTLSNNLSVGGTTTVTGATQINNTLGVSGVASITNATDSSAVSNGALVVSGGMGVAKKVYLGSTLNVAGATQINNTLNAGATTLNSLVVPGTMTVSDTVGFGGATQINNTLGVSGATTLSNNLSVGGTTSLSGSVGIGGATQINNTLGVSGATTLSNNLSVGGTTTVTGATQINNTLGVSGVASITNATDSSAVSNGALVVSGGMGVAKSATIGGNVVINGDKQATSATSAALVVAGGLGIGKHANIAGDLYVGGATVFAGGFGVSSATTITDTTESNSANSGAFRVYGGVGIGANLNVAGNLGVTKAVALSSTLAVTGIATLSNNLSVGGTATVTGATQVNNTLGVSGVATLSNNLSVGGTASITGATSLSNNLTVAGATQVNNTLGVSGVASITNATDSSAVSNGALVVSGGMGVAKKAYLGDTLNVAGASTLQSSLAVGGTASITGATTLSNNLSVGGTATVTGATQINNTLGVTGVASITNATDSSAVSNGALVVSGGMGVAKKTYLGDTLNVAGVATLQNGLTVAGATQINNTLVAGATTLNSLAVSGGVTVSSTVGFGGATQINNTLGVSGATTLSSSMSVGGTATVTGATTLNNGLTVNNADSIFNKSVHIMGNLFIDGNMIYSNVENVNIQDKLITINKGATNNAFDTGIEMELNGAIVGYMKSSANGEGLVLKAPNKSGVVSLNGLTRNSYLLQSESDSTQLISTGSLKLDAADSVLTANANVVLGYGSANKVVLNSGLVDASSNAKTLTLASSSASALAVGSSANANLFKIDTQNNKVYLSNDLQVDGSAINLSAAAKSVSVIDNNASAFSISSSGKADILKVVSTTNASRIETAGLIINSKVDSGSASSRNNLSSATQINANGYCGTLYFNNLVLNQSGLSKSIVVKSNVFSSATNVMTSIENFSDATGAGVPPIVWANRLSDNTGFTLNFAQVFNVDSAIIDVKYLVC